MVLIWNKDMAIAVIGVVFGLAFLGMLGFFYPPIFLASKWISAWILLSCPAILTGFYFLGNKIIEPLTSFELAFSLFFLPAGSYILAYLLFTAIQLMVLWSARIRKMVVAGPIIGAGIYVVFTFWINGALIKSAGGF